MFNSKIINFKFNLDFVVKVYLLLLRFSTHLGYKFDKLNPLKYVAPFTNLISCIKTYYTLKGFWSPYLGWNCTTFFFHNYVSCRPPFCSYSLNTCYLQKLIVPLASLLQDPLCLIKGHSNQNRHWLSWSQLWWTFSWSM